ncbi:biorientation of chromosomes in cell division protein 1-like 1 [Lucilia cuprina]|uniref:biorientation of chromosomes in cell division protein 1-like 1 n=1 Tax=Lucilia cuprina TaxID=7375 RepID=UPI001F06CD30|nr:biorientation of chromosomes in cell division protein 1-like 1 [Lucilia cuprina]
MDTQLVEKIVHEVKSQGVFDEFRKDSMADVDTKPAYQNLRQRVENTVKKFLSEQKWTPETNKNQLREKLRRHITESGFLDVGVERIVDQVVNPKIGSVFQPRIEEIAYKYLGLPPPPKKFEPPPPPLMHPLPPLPLNAPPLKVETCSLLPTDLEQVSPDSDKGTVKSEGKDDRTTVDMDTEEKLMEDEEESPPFEPLVKQELDETKELVKVETKDEKPNIKQECDESLDDKANKLEESNEVVLKTENMVNDNDSQETSNFATESAAVDKDASQSVDARISQDSQLSSVSSDSRLSVNGKEDSLQSKMQTPKQTIRPSTPNTTPIPTPPLPTPTATPSPVTTQKPDKEHQSRHSSSSSSRHKKHSKERRRSHEREKEKDSRDRHRSSKDSKDSSRHHSSSSGNKSSSSKHSSSSSSKYSSSHNKSSEKDIDKSSSSSTHSSSKHIKHSHSHSSSSSNENQDSKKSKRDSERKHHSSSSSSSKRSERKDDHAEAKHKTQRRKSTDSNDDEGDKSMGGHKSNSHYKASYTSSSQGKSSKSKSSDGNKTNDTQKDQLDVTETNELNTNKLNHVNNVVILNDILENPQTQFIQLNNTGHLVETPQVAQSETTATKTENNQDVTAEFNNNITPLESQLKEEVLKEVKNEQESNDLLYFDEIQLNLTERLKLLNATMDLCRSAVNSLRFDSLSDEGIELSNEEDVNSDSKTPNLMAESLKRKPDYNYSEFETTPRKRVMSQASEGCQSKTSPTPSDTSSINSKENEEIVKNTNHAKKSLIERHKSAQKLSQQQRYSSEDLYKPRPILGQRSRRRGMDSLV